MIVKNITLKNFRNFGDASLEFNDKINWFCGSNGAGKTNILEAVFMLLLARSPRGAADSTLINDKSDYYRIDGDVITEEKSCRVATAAQKGGRKKITIDKLPVRNAELFELFSAVSLAPGDIEIFSGAPMQRRDFINIYLSQASAGYLADLTLYRKVLAQKNAFLKLGSNNNDNPYDDLLVKYGVSIMQARHEFIRAVSLCMTDNYAKISAGQSLEIIYLPSVPVGDENFEAAHVAEEFKRRLIQNRSREQILQSSIIGPHRDDIDFRIRCFPARTHGSQGELRTAAIALKLAVYEYLKARKKITPVLLMDEIFAELDNDRKQLLIGLFGNFGQLFITTAAPLSDMGGLTGTVFKINNGVVVEN